MTTYRLYTVRQDHIAGPPAIITADSDSEAVEKAFQLMYGDSMEIEVWELARRVAKLSSTNPAISFDAKRPS